MCGQKQEGSDSARTDSGGWRGAGAEGAAAEGRPVRAAHVRRDCAHEGTARLRRASVDSGGCGAFAPECASVVLRGALDASGLGGI